MFLSNFEKDQVGFKEFFSIFVIIIGTKATDMSTVLLFRDGLNASWMIMIGSFLFIIPSLLLLNRTLKKYQDKNILEVTQLALGKPVAYAVAFIMLFFTLINTATDSRSYMTQLADINFPNTPLFILYLCFLTICMWGAKKGWESIGSIAWAVLPYLMFALALLLFLMMKEAVFYRLFPLFGPGKWEIVKASFNYSSLYGDVFVLALMYPFVKNHKTYTRGLYTSLLFTVSMMALLCLSYVWIFDFRSVEKITYLYNESIQFVSLGRTVTNIETFFITFWLVSVFVKFIVYIYVVCNLFGFLFHIKEFEHTVFPITLLILVIAMIPENNEFNMFMVRRFTLTYFKYLFFCLPPILWVVTKIKVGRVV